MKGTIKVLVTVEDAREVYEFMKSAQWKQWVDKHEDEVQEALGKCFRDFLCDNPY